MSSAPTHKNPTIARGNVHWVDFGQKHSRELYGIHPAIVISPDDHNSNPWFPLVRVVPLTTPRRPPFDDEVVIEPHEHGLCSPSLARVIQTRAVDRACILGWNGRVTARTMRQIELVLLKTNGIGIAQAQQAAEKGGSDGGNRSLQLAD